MLITVFGVSPKDRSPIMELLSKSRSRTGAKLISSPEAITSDAINHPKLEARIKPLSLSCATNLPSFCIEGKTA